MTLATKTGSVFFNQKGDPGEPGEPGKPGENGKIGPLVYPAGEYSDTETYIKTDLSTPVVLFENEYYVLNSEEPVTGINPKLDYAEGGDKAHWIRMTKFKYAFIEILMANFAKLASAIFSGDYMLSQYGKDAAGNDTNEYKNFDPAKLFGDDCPFTPNIFYNFLKGTGALGAGKIKFLEGGGVEMDNINVNNAIISGASRYTGDKLPVYMKVTSQYIIADLNYGKSGYTYLWVPTERFGGKMNLKLNQAIEITFINMTNKVINIGTTSGAIVTDQKGKFEYFSSIYWQEPWPESSSRIQVDSITVPQYFPVELIFIPTAVNGIQYAGKWIVKNPRLFQLYYHPNAAANLKYDLVPINSNAAITK